jgi:hypothetical protein
VPQESGRFSLLFVADVDAVKYLHFKEGTCKYPSRVAAGGGFLASFELLEFEFLEFEFQVGISLDSSQVEKSHQRSCHRIVRSTVCIPLIDVGAINRPALL